MKYDSPEVLWIHAHTRTRTHSHTNTHTHTHRHELTRTHTTHFGHSTFRSVRWLRNRPPPFIIIPRIAYGFSCLFFLYSFVLLLTTHVRIHYIVYIVSLYYYIIVVAAALYYIVWASILCRYRQSRRWWLVCHYNYGIGIRRLSISPDRKQRIIRFTACIF